MSSLTKRLAMGLAVLVCLTSATFAGPAGASPLHGRSTVRSASARTRARNSRAQRTREARAHRAAEQAALSRAAVIAATLDEPCTDTELVPSAGDIALVSGAVLCLINRERAEHGVLPLSTNPDLGQAAEGHVEELVADDYFAHITPSGYTPMDRIRATGYIPGAEVGYAIGENLAWGTLNLSTSSAIVRAWIASPDHLANILDSQYTETGVGIIASVPSSLGGGEPGALYAQEFGVIVQ